MLYYELRRLAAGYLAREREPNTLQPTAHVHEAWLRLAKKSRPDMANRTHFLAAAAGVMCCILIERARPRARPKHGGGRARLVLDAAEPSIMTPDHKIILIEDALAELEADAPELARVVVLKFYGGMTMRKSRKAWALPSAPSEGIGACQGTAV